jgi:excisionase family DNA binding protein
MAKQLSLADISDSQPAARRPRAVQPPNGEARRQPAEADDVLTVREVAALLKLSPRTVGEYGARGVLPSVKIGRHRRFSKRELEALIASPRDSRAV